MLNLPLRLWMQVQNVVKTLRIAAAWMPVAAGGIALIVSLLIVPQTEPSVWNWFGLPLIALLTSISLLAMVQRTMPRTSPTARNELLLLAGFGLVLATVLNLFLTLAGTAFLLVGVCLIAAVALRYGRTSQPSMPLTGIVVVLVPIWCWLSLDQATAGLLLPIALACLAWFADSQMQHALGADTTESATASRASRFISWLSVLFGAVLTTLLAISSDIGNGWAVIGALGAVACIAADAGVPQHASLPGRYSRPLMGLAFAWLLLCWLVSL
jgi:hypothetical protein